MRTKFRCAQFYSKHLKIDLLSPYLTLLTTFANNNMEDIDQRDREEVYSKAVRAGKRTYFFDVKKTRNEDLYITITESKKRFNANGKFFFEKHKIFLYKEDFEKFADNLTDVIQFVKAKLDSDDLEIHHKKAEPTSDVSVENEVEDFVSVEFEDLNEVK